MACLSCVPHETPVLDIPPTPPATALCRSHTHRAPHPPGTADPTQRGFGGSHFQMKTLGSLSSLFPGSEIALAKDVPFAWLWMAQWAQKGPPDAGSQQLAQPGPGKETAPRPPGQARGEPAALPRATCPSAFGTLVRLWPCRGALLLMPLGACPPGRKATRRSLNTQPGKTRGSGCFSALGGRVTGRFVRVSEDREGTGRDGTGTLIITRNERGVFAPPWLQP